MHRLCEYNVTTGNAEPTGPIPPRATKILQVETRKNSSDSAELSPGARHGCGSALTNKKWGAYGVNHPLVRTLSTLTHLQAKARPGTKVSRQIQLSNSSRCASSADAHPCRLLFLSVSKQPPVTTSSDALKVISISLLHITSVAGLYTIES